MSKTLTTVTIADIRIEAEGENARGTWKRSSLLLAPDDADLSQTVSVIEADTFENDVPAVGTKCRVVIENKRRIVGQNTYDNQVVTRFIPIG